MFRKYGVEEGTGEEGPLRLQKGRLARRGMLNFHFEEMSRGQAMLL